MALILAELAQTTALAGAGFAALALFATGPALAQTKGGDGGIGGAGAGGGDGGGLGPNAVGQPGDNGHTGSDVPDAGGGGGGGGGGPGGGQGGTGGDGFNNPGSGKGAGQNGDPSSQLNVGAGGAGGGDGGVHAPPAEQSGPFDITQRYKGGGGVKGGTGGSASGYGSNGGGGGGGGAGGYGQVMNFSGVIGTGGSATGGVGGAGGDGGDGYSAGGAGGTGGDGGVGIYSDGSKTLTLENDAAIQGGHGGVGGNNGTGTVHQGSAGSGGSGGSGIYANNLQITNTGTIRGGDGGDGGNGGSISAGGDGGAGGHGISGKNLTIINSGTISGGSGGAAGTGTPNGQKGADGKPINFTGGTNVLELRAGSSITGNVKAFSTADTLRLGGTTDSTFDVSQIGASAKYQGFGIYEKTGSGTWTLDNTTTALTPWTIKAGTLSIAADGALGKNTGSITFDGGTLYATETFTSARDATIARGSNATFNVAHPEDLTWSGVISGEGELIVWATGNLILTGKNTYTGGTKISDGVLTLGNGGASGSIQGNVSVARETWLDFNRSDTYTFSGVISGGGTVEQIGTGTTVLSGANTYKGGTYISAGALQVSSDGNLGDPSGDLSFYGGTLENTASFTSSRAVTLNSGGGTFNTGDTQTGKDLTLTGVIGGNGGLTKAGASTLTLSGSNTYKGGTTVNAGTLSISSNGNLGDVFGSLTFGGGTLLNTAGLDLTGRGDVTLGSGGGTFNTGGSDTGKDLTLAGTTGAGKLTKTGKSTLILSGDAGHTGGTTVSEGTLQIGDGGTSGTIAGAITNNAKLTFNRSNSYTYGGKITGSGDVEQTGAGTLTLTANNSYSGTTTISTGTLQLGNGGTTGSVGSGDIVNKGTLIFNRSDDALTLSGVISGAGTVTQKGSGTTTLSGDNSYKGATNVNAGTLVIDGDQSQATGKTTVASGATLGGGGTLGGNVEVKSGGILLSEDSNADGVNALTINGKLTVDANAALDYNYGLSPSGDHNQLMIDVGGDVTFGGTVNISKDSSVTLAAGIYGLLQYGGTKSGDLTLGTTPTGSYSLHTDTAHKTVELINATGVNLHFWDGGNAANQDNGVVDGGDGTWQASGGNSNWTEADGSINGSYADGSMAIFKGTAGTVTVDTSKGAVKVQGMQFAVDGYTITGGAVTLNSGDNTIRVGQGGSRDVTYTATIESKLTGAGKLIKGDAGTLVLTNANNDYAGGTEIDAGTLSISSDGNLGATSSGLSFDGGTLQNTAAITSTRNVEMLTNGGTFQTDHKLTLTGLVSGVGALTKTGSDTLVLTNASNSYQGGTNLNAGTISVASDGNLGDASGGLTFSGGTLLNTQGFSSSRAVTLNSGGGTFQTSANLTLTGDITGGGKLTKTGSSTLTLTGDAGHTGGTAISAGTLQIGNGAAAGTIAGDITNNGTLSFNRSGTLTVGGDITGSGKVVQKGGGTTVLTGTNSYRGGTQITAGTLQLGDGSTTGSITGNVSVSNGATLAFDPSSSSTLTVGGDITGGGKVVQKGRGTTVLMGTNSYGGGTTISGGTLQIGNGGRSGSLSGDVSVASGAMLAFNRSNSYTFGGNITGDGKVKQAGSGTVVLTGTNNYHGGTEIARGTLQIGNGGTSGSITGDVDTDGTLAFNRSNTYTFGGDITGSGEVHQMGGGTTVLTGTNKYGGGTTISGGTLQIGNGAASGSITGDVTNNGTLAFNRSDDAYTFSGKISGNGNVVQAGSGTTTLSGAHSYKGTTQVRNGTLIVNGDQSAATGTTTMLSGGTLSGKGTLGGDVAVNNGGTLAIKDDGSGITKLAVNGGLSLATGSDLDYEYGVSPDGTNHNALMVDVAGDLALDGTINVKTDPNVTLAPGIYGLIHYGGDLTSKNYTVGTMPPGDFEIQTAIDGRVNLLNATGINLHFWDPSQDGSMEGGDGVWQAESGNTNWTDSTGTEHGGFTDDSFAIFHGQAGTVTVDESKGTVRVGGMQFATDGYVVQGDSITLGADRVTVRVGDSAPVSAGYTATIHSKLAGHGKLTKADLGTLVLTGANDYAGGTEITAGTLNVSADNNLGASGTKITMTGGTLQFGGSFNTGRNVTLGADATIDTMGNTNTLRGTIDGTGGLTKEGSGTLALSGANSFSGGLTVDEGTVRAGAANTAFGSGQLTVKSGATADLAGFDATVGGLAGAGNVTLGSGTLISTQSGTSTFSGIISGSGGLSFNGSGTLTLSGANSYTGATQVTNGTLIVNGDQSAATGKTTVSVGGTLSGKGTLGGDVDVRSGGTLAIKDDGSGITKLSVQGNLSIASGGNLNYTYGLAPNGNHDALMVDDVGDLTLDGTINVATEDGVTLTPGLYGLIHYHGDLKSANYTVGTIPAGDFEIQTAIAGRVNLVNSTGANLHFWDPNGQDGGTIEGGSGVWQAAAGNANWTDASGTSHGGFTDDGFAIFHGKPGTVTVDDSLGAVRVSGMQFGVNGYVVKGDGITLGTDPATIRVGDGTTAGADFMATILSDLSGDAKLIKSDHGTLVLAGDNSYTGGTEIDAGTLNVSKDVNLGAAGTKITIDGGTLQFGSSFDTDRNVTLGAGHGVIDTGANTNTLSGVIDGAGTLTKDGAGTLRLTGDSAYGGPTTIAAGRLVVDGSIASAVTVSKQGILSGTGTVGDVTNEGLVAPGADTDVGTLTVDGDYTGKQGRLAVDTYLAGDASPTDHLHVTGATFGDTTITVHNAGGPGAQTVEGIRIVDVDGASKGTFTLDGHYEAINGEQGIVAGAYTYTLHQGSPTYPDDGDWYLRSHLSHDNTIPHYQPGVPLYSVYEQVLTRLNTAASLRARMGGRSWTDDTGSPIVTAAIMPTPAEIGAEGQKKQESLLWGRVLVKDGRYNLDGSTTGNAYDLHTWRLEAGLDALLRETDAGQLLGGIWLKMVDGQADVSSPFGTGSLDTTGYGVAAALTWFGHDGIYADAQAHANWYETDIISHKLDRTLGRNEDAFGYVLSLEAGRRIALDANWSVTPQVQLVYSALDTEDLRHDFGADVFLNDNDSLTGRFGLAVNYDTAWRNAGGKVRQATLYGVANIYQQFIDQSQAIEISGTRLATGDDSRTWGEIGLGGTYKWQRGKYGLYGNITTAGSLENFADSYNFGGELGFNVKW